MKRWLRHPIETLLWHLRGYDEEGWRTRLARPFLRPAPKLVQWEMDGVLETWEYMWVAKVPRGWEEVGRHPAQDGRGEKRKSILVRRRLR